MKRYLSLLFGLLLIVALWAVPVQAAADVVLTFSQSEKNLSPGDTVVVTVNAEAQKACTHFGLIMEYDKAVFEVVSGDCTVSGALLRDFSPERGIVAMYAIASKPSGQVATITLQVKADAPAGETVFTGNPSVKNGGDTVSSAVNRITFLIEGAGNAPSQEHSVDAPETPDQPVTNNRETTEQTEQTQQTEQTVMQQPSQTVEQTQKLETGKPENPADNNILLIAVIAVAVVALLAVGGYWILKRKKL